MLSDEAELNNVLQKILDESKIEYDKDIRKKREEETMLIS